MKPPRPSSAAPSHRQAPRPRTTISGGAHVGTGGSLAYEHSGGDSGDGSGGDDGGTAVAAIDAMSFDELRELAKEQRRALRGEGAAGPRIASASLRARATLAARRTTILFFGSHVPFLRCTFLMWEFSGEPIGTSSDHL